MNGSCGFCSSLIEAIRRSHLGCVQTFPVDDFSVFDDKGLLPIHHAAGHASPEVVEYVLSKAPQHLNTRSRDEEGCPPIYCTLAMNENVGSFRVFLEHGAKVNFVDSENWTLLHQLACIGEVESIDEVIRRGCPTDVKNFKGKTYLDLLREYELEN